MAGYTEKELLNLIQHPTPSSLPYPYWTSEVYGFGQGIREYGYYPSWLPLFIFTDHGVSRDVSICNIELEHDAEAMFYHSIDSVNEFKQKSNISCYCYYSPLAFFRKNNKIEKDKNAKGTLAFPQHSMSSTNIDLDRYIQQLKDLDREFHPVSICVHRDDIESGIYKKFLDAGFDLFTAGHPSDINYAKRFYNNLSKFKYATSNMPGSYLFYAVEMNIPFFIYGDEVFFNNFTNEKNEIIEKYTSCSFPQYKKTYELFYGIRKEITKEQKVYVEKMLGMKDCISRFEMAKILYLSYLKRGNIWKDFFRYIKYSRRSFYRYLRNSLKYIINKDIT